MGLSQLSRLELVLSGNLRLGSLSSTLGEENHLRLDIKGIIFFIRRI